jgi:acetyl esterase/lipase
MGMMVADVGELRASHPLLQYAGARLIGIPKRDRSHPLVWLSSDALDRGQDMGVSVIDTKINTGGIRNLRAAGTDWSMVVETREANSRHIIDRYPVAPGGLGLNYLTDRDGELAYGFTMADGLGSVHRFENGNWLKCPIDFDQVDVRSAGNLPGQLVVLAPSEEGKPRALRFMEASTGTPGEVLVQDPDYDFSGWTFRDPVSREIVGAMYDRAGPHTVWFSKAYQRAQKAVEALFPQRLVRVIDVDESGRFLVSVFSDRQPPIYHRVDLKARTVGLLKNSSPWIDPERMRPMNVLNYKTRDGRKLDAYVTLPVGASKQTPAPLVVLPHGGPWVRDTWGFDAQVQFLASRGFAVLQPNYRGSPGYDWRFPEEDLYDFQKMHGDVTDAAKALLATGLVDAKRVAIMGTSFGAYLALCGAVNEPDFYRCAVAIAGVFDWEAVMKDARSEQYSSAQYGYMKRKLGDPKKQQDKYEAISPVRHIERVRVPVFVSHGKDDPIAHVGESKRLIAELKKHRVLHETLLIGGEGHGMAHLKNEVELHSRIEVFLRKHLAAEPTKAAGQP